MGGDFGVQRGDFGVQFGIQRLDFDFQSRHAPVKRGNGVLDAGHLRRHCCDVGLQLLPVGAGIGAQVQHSPDDGDHEYQGGDERLQLFHCQTPLPDLSLRCRYPARSPRFSR